MSIESNKFNTGLNFFTKPEVKEPPVPVKATETVPVGKPEVDKKDLDISNYTKEALWGQMQVQLGNTKETKKPEISVAQETKDYLISLALAEPGIDRTKLAAGFEKFSSHTYSEKKSTIGGIRNEEELMSANLVDSHFAVDSKDFLSALDNFDLFS